jgi:predicted RNA-binding Zn-ribbon protein involved in translation (DUF1610 family)
MADLITLNCPSCGGKLQVDPTSSKLTCNHCGNDHFVHREGSSVTLESFARCPKCSRNDRVEKVTAILRSHKQEVTSTEQRTEVYVDQNGVQHTRTHEVPKTVTQVTGLARVLIPPEKPDPLPRPKLRPKPQVGKPQSARSALKIILIIIALVTILGSCLLSLIAFGILMEDATLDSLLCGVPALIIMLGGFALFIFGLIMKPVDKEKLAQWQRERARIVKNWQDENQQRLADWEAANNEIMDKYAAAVENWQNLYYCHRDDCVFVPGKGTSATIEKLQEYLFE